MNNTSDGQRAISPKPCTSHCHPEAGATVTTTARLAGEVASEQQNRHQQAAGLCLLCLLAFTANRETRFASGVRFGGL